MNQMKLLFSIFIKILNNGCQPNVFTLNTLTRGLCLIDINSIDGLNKMGQTLVIIQLFRLP